MKKFSDQCQKSEDKIIVQKVFNYIIFSRFSFNIFFSLLKYVGFQNESKHSFSILLPWFQIRQINDEQFNKNKKCSKVELFNCFVYKRATLFNSST